MKIINIAIATATLAIVSLPNQLFGQETVSYGQTITAITTFNKEKSYSATTTGPILDVIVWGMVDNDYLFLSEGLKFRLVGGTITAAKVKTEAAGASDVYEGNLLQLLFYTKNAVPPFISDDGLRIRVGGVRGQGTVIKTSVETLWKNKSITTNLIECLEGFEPQTAAVLVDVISKVWFTPPNRVYEDTDTSWASQSLQQIYHDVNEVELAKRSVVVKLLAQQGYIQIPGVTYAVFEWSAQQFGYNKWPDIPIYLDPVTWSSSDIPSLERLAGNPNYSAAAIQELEAMGVAGY